MIKILLINYNAVECISHFFLPLAPSMKHYFSFFIQLLLQANRDIIQDKAAATTTTAETFIPHFIQRGEDGGRILEFDSFASPNKLMMLKQPLPSNDDESTEISKTPDGEAVNSIFTNTPSTFDDHHRSKSNTFGRSTSNFIK